MSVDRKWTPTENLIALHLQQRKESIPWSTDNDAEVSYWASVMRRTKDAVIMRIANFRAFDHKTDKKGLDGALNNAGMRFTWAIYGRSPELVRHIVAIHESAYEHGLITRDQLIG